MPFRHPSLLSAFVCAALAGLPVRAQQPLPDADGVFRTEFADVLRAEPVYPVAGEHRVSSNCVTATSSQGSEYRGRVQRPVSARPPARGREADVNEVVFSADVECTAVPLGTGAGDPQIPVAWDVDYILRGIKYRSRLPYDPGARLRVRVSVTPVVTPADAPARP